MDASAPAKTILFGEHAVVYGYPGIATPISSLRARAATRPETMGSGLRIVLQDMQEQSIRLRENPEHPLAIAAQLLLDSVSAPEPDWTITVTSDIPIASGLGSGAAVTTALMRALASALGASLANEHLNEMVYAVEKIHHGTPSGIDNTVIVFEKPLYFRRGTVMESIQVGKPITLLIGDTGVSASTRVAVSDVRQLFNSQVSATTQRLEEIGSLVERSRQLLQVGAVIKLGQCMIQNHQLLQWLTVSSPELDRLVDAAVTAGALGAKLSGGGRGGNMIALVQPDSVQSVREALLSAGAVHVFQTKVETC